MYRGQDKPIAISRFEDGSLYVRDGHHRICAAIIVGMKTLWDDEYEIEDYCYEDYLTPNFSNGFFTPFDPRTQCRLPNFFDFKDQVLDLYNDEKMNVDYPNPGNFSHVYDFIEINSSKYREPRRIKSFVDLVGTYRHY
jgi:hypothetical protein